MRYFLAFLIIAVLFFPPYSHAQDKAGICDRYARSALEFQKQNLLNRCGYSGPEWSDNFRYHFDWCMNGQNFRSAEKWTQWREVRIANCRSTSNLGNLQHQEVQDTTTACRNYASDAVRQQQENIRLSCGLVGPEWNLEFQYHYAWCMNGNNLQSAQNGHNLREQQLVQCKSEKNTQKIPVSKGSLRSFPATSVSVNIEALLNRLNQGTDEIRSRSAAKPSQQLGTGTVAWQSLTAVGQMKRPVEDATAFIVKMQSVLDSAPKVRQDNLTLPPRINSVLTSPVNGRVEPGTSLLISGMGFGSSPGKVFLSYEVRRETPSTESRPEAVVTETVSLDPFRASWSESWFPNLIIAKASTTYRDPFLAADRTGKLRIVLTDGTELTSTLTVGSGTPVIDSVVTQNGRNWIRPGDRFVVHGRNFGTEGPPSVILNLPSEQTKVWQKIRGVDRYVFWPKQSGAQAGSTQIAVNIINWSNHHVELEAGHYATNRYFGGLVGTLILENKSGQRGFHHDIWYGPDNQVKVVSGLPWLDNEAKKHARETANRAVTLVTHTPSCGIINSGEKGGDVFFTDEPWPQDIEIIGFDFKMIDPSDRYSDADFFIDQMGDIVDALSSGPFGIAQYIGSRVLDAIFSGGGGYHAYVQHAPGGYSWDKGPHVIVIGWETACILSGKPIAYVVSFTIAGTPEALARY